MHRQAIDPRFFGDRFGYNRAIVLERPRRWLVVAGHEARADDGSVAASDMATQIRLTIQRLGETLDKAGFTLADIVQIRSFTINLQAMKSNYHVLLDTLAEANCRPTSLLAEVSALSDPNMLLEIEALAAQ
jgi:enamine deaminase RidA (YjgF/YER057c/UK114 family)